MPLTPEQFDRLPQYARREIERLRREVTDAHAQLAAGPENSDTFVDDYSLSPDRPLGTGPIIRFGEDGPGGLTARLHNGVLEISSFFGGLVISPVASNHVEIQARHR